MDLYQQNSQLHGRAGKRIDAHQRLHQQEDRAVGKAHGKVGPEQQLAGVVDGLFVVPRADAAAHHRDHGQTDGLAGDDAHAVEVVGHGVGRDLHCAKGGDHADDEDAARLKQAVLEGGRDADAQNAPGQAAVQPQGLGNVQQTAFFLFIALAQDQGRRHHAGNDAGPCDAIDAHFQAEDADGVAHNVDDVHQKADLHGDLGVAHAAEQRRTAVVQRKERVAQGDDLQVEHTGFQHVGINGAVE